MTENTSKARIAIVEDDALVRASLCDCLESAGYESEGFASVEEVLASNSRSIADCFILDVACVIFDIQLPGASGLELQHRLGDAARPTSVLLGSSHTLLESEIFGDEKGTLTGAVTSRMGDSRLRIEARFFSMQLENCRLSFSPSSRGPCRNKNSNGSGVPKPLVSMCAYRRCGRSVISAVDIPEFGEGGKHPVARSPSWRKILPDSPKKTTRAPSRRIYIGV